LQLPRNIIKLGLRIRLGHYPTKKFAHMMNKTDSPNCDVCGRVEDVQHLLMECIKNQTVRSKFMRRFNLNRLDVGIAQSILSNPTSAAAIEIYLLVAASHERLL
jgi:hypothetical protein